jgi:hypothetical protein
MTLYRMPKLRVATNPCNILRSSNATRWWLHECVFRFHYELIGEINRWRWVREIWRESAMCYKFEVPPK